MKGKAGFYLGERPEDCQSPTLPSNSPPGHILIVAGEASGDQHGARLVAEMQKLLPKARFVGIGGEALAAQGVRLLARAEELAVVGLTEVVGRLPAVLRALGKIRRLLRQEPPALVILIDFPDFNFLVARLAKWQGVPVMYYISPQVWAWRRYRVHTIARYVDRLAVIFPFEEEFYRQQGVAADFVGHPLMEILPELPERPLLLKNWGLTPDRLTLALLPGSRGSEIERHLPTMLAAAKIIHQTVPETQFLLPLASTAPRALVEEIIEEILGGGPGNTIPGPSLTIIPGQAYAALRAAHLAVVASGTVTVEAALAGTPTVIIYRLAPLTYQAAKLLIRVDHIGMANLLAGEAIFPELIQNKLTPERLAQEVLQWVQEPARLKRLGPALAQVATSLGGPGASAGAARLAGEIIRYRPEIRFSK